MDEKDEIINQLPATNEEENKDINIIKDNNLINNENINENKNES